MAEAGRETQCAGAVHVSPSPEAVGTGVEAIVEAEGAPTGAPGAGALGAAGVLMVGWPGGSEVAAV